MVNIQRHLFISGRVQGVSFRASLLREAKRYPQLRGFVRNLSDGRVEAVIQGAEDSVLSLAAWCRTGPPHANVTELEVREEPADSKLNLFQIT